jgi:hypothetical protein
LAAVGVAVTTRGVEVRVAIRMLGGKGVAVPSRCACAVNRTDCVAAAKTSSGCGVGVITVIPGVGVARVTGVSGVGRSFAPLTVPVTIGFGARLAGTVVGVAAGCATDRVG